MARLDGPLSSTVDDVRDAVFAPHYPALGRLLEFEAMALDSRVSNQHFRLTTERGQFILKQVLRPDALFERAGIERLAVVSRVIRALGEQRLRVERIVPAADGALCLSHGPSIFRLYEWVEGRAFDRSDRDLSAAARALRAFHERGLPALDSALVLALSGFSTPYPLAETATRVDQIFAFLRNEPTPELLAIAEHEALLREEIEIGLCADKENVPDQLVHLDFHPDNVIFVSGQEPVIIDLDNILIGDPRKCLAFSVMRFAPKGELLRSLAVWKSSYGIESSRQLFDFMTQIEVEKILRIVYRVIATGAYRNFLPNILSRHVPNLIEIRGARAAFRD